MVDMALLKSKNTERWSQARLTRNFVSVAKSLCAAKSRYLTIQKYTWVPWFVVAVIHEREADQKWDANLSQGDPWNRVSIHVPKGRGPFMSWEAAAIDALTNCSPYAAKNHDWSVGGTLTLLEEYNGLGYASRGIPSPYIWSGTNQYTSGKYIRDGVFSSGTVDVQLGCAGLLLAMQAMDDSVAIGGPVSDSAHPASPLPPTSNSPAGELSGIVVSTSEPDPNTGLAGIINWIKTWFS